MSALTFPGSSFVGSEAPLLCWMLEPLSPFRSWVKTSLPLKSSLCDRSLKDFEETVEDNGFVKSLPNGKLVIFLAEIIRFSGIELPEKPMSGSS